MLEKAFASFGHQVKVVEIETGPVIAQYEIELEKGLRLSKITGLADDVAIALRGPQCPHRGADPRQEHRRDRGAERRTATGAIARGDGELDGENEEDGNPPVPG